MPIKIPDVLYGCFIKMSCFSFLSTFSSKSFSEISVVAIINRISAYIDYYKPLVNHYTDSPPSGSIHQTNLDYHKSKGYFLGNIQCRSHHIPGSKYASFTCSITKQIILIMIEFKRELFSFPCHIILC